MRILVSIINWNNNAATSACLASIAKITKQQQPDIYLIDNNSQDEPLVVSEEATHNLKSLQIVYNKINKGFAGGHNDAINFAVKKDYDFICLLNNDTEITDPDTFTKLATALNQNEAAVAAAPTIVSKSHPSTIWFAGGTMNINKCTTTHNYVGMDISVLQDINNVTACKFLTGCCFMIALKKQPLFKKTFDEKYFLYWEDADWCANAYKFGAELLYVKDAHITHATSSSLGMRSASYAYYNVRNQLLFARKWSALHKVLPKNFWVGFRIIGLSLKKPSTTLKITWHIQKAFWDGLRGKGGMLR